MAETASLSLNIVLDNGNIKFLYGSTQVPGDILASGGHKIILKCDRPFAIFIKYFIAASVALDLPYAFQFAAGNPETPFDGLVFASNDQGEIRLNVKLLAKKGNYGYGVAVLDTSYNIVTLDPRIIID